jgi:DNA-binding transcriptional regulator WhiA
MKQIILTGHTGQTTKKYNYKKKYPVRMDVNKYSAELAGILLGDGSISIYPKINHYRLQITLNSDEKEYAEYIRQLFKRMFEKELSIKFRKDENTLDLLCFNRKIIRELIDFGFIISPKWNRAIVPKQFMNFALGKYVLRGYFDTDGCVAITNNNGTIYPRLEMKIMPSPMKQQLQELLNMYGFKYGVYEIGRGEVRIQMNGKKQLEKWKKEIGFSNKKINQ